jgi:membrane protein
MDWLTRLPWIGPRVRAALRTHAWRAFDHLQSVHWTRLAAAMTFTSFLSLFPLLAVVAAVGAATLSKHQLDTIEHKISEQIPGIADQLNISGLVANAGTVGGIAAVLLVFTGIGWVGSLRDCLRAVWAKDNEERNPVIAKIADFGVLVGLGAAVIVSLGASGFATAAVGWAADRIGLAGNSPGRALLTVVGFVLAVVADFLILTYLLTLLPGVEPPRRSVVVASLIGAVGFEALKLLLSSYLQGVAGKNIYGAFGTPVALLLWINFMAKLLLYCAAWTATPVHASDAPLVAPPDGKSDGKSDASSDEKKSGESGADRPDEPGESGGSGAPGERPEEPVSPSAAGSPHAAGAHRWVRRTRRPPRREPPLTEADGGAVPR